MMVVKDGVYQNHPIALKVYGLAPEYQFTGLSDDQDLAPTIRPLAHENGGSVVRTLIHVRWRLVKHPN